MMVSPNSPSSLAQYCTCGVKARRLPAQATDNHEAMTSKEANIKKIAELTGVEWEILKYWEKGFFCIDDSEGFQEGNIVKDDLPQLLCKLNVSCSSC